MSDISTWDVNGSNNVKASPNGFPVLMVPGGVDDSAREIMAAVARSRKDKTGELISSGSDNGYRLSTNQAFADLGDIDELVFKANFSNTDTATLKVNTLALKTIVKADGELLSSNDIKRDQLVAVRFNTVKDKFVITTPLGNPNFNKEGTIDNSKQLDGLNHTASDAVNSIVSRDGTGGISVKRLNLTNLSTTTLDDNDFIVILDNNEAKKATKAHFLSWLATGIVALATAWTPQNQYFSPGEAENAARQMVPSNALPGTALVSTYQKTSGSRSWQSRATYVVIA